MDEQANKGQKAKKQTQNQTTKEQAMRRASRGKRRENVGKDGMGVCERGGGWEETGGVALFSRSYRFSSSSLS